MILSASVGFINLDTTSKKIISIKENNIVINNLLVEVKESSVKRIILLLEMVESDNAFRQVTLSRKITSLANSSSNATEKLMLQGLDGYQKTLLARQSNVNEYNILLEKEAHNLLNQGKIELAKALLVNLNIEYRYTNLKNLAKISEDLTKKSNTKIIELNAKQEGLINAIIITALSSLLICVLLTVIIVKAQKQNNKKLEKLANTDLLTSLPNRTKLISSVEKAISNKNEGISVIAFLDIDYFKSINDSYGHDIGDEVLKRFAEKIKKSLHTDDILSRFGGDEFVLFLKSITSAQQTVRFMSKLTKELNTSFVIQGKEVFVSSSIGVNIHMHRNSQQDVKTLLNRADSAMYSAKEAGRNCFHLFSKKTYEKMQRESTLSHALHTIIKNKNANNELFLKYQPLINLGDDNKMLGCEALLRWVTKDGTAIPTEEFIRVAENTNLIDDINQLVIKEACAQQRKWQMQGGEDIRININLSGNKNSFCRLLTHFNNLLEDYMLAPSLFGIELTERTILEVTQDTIYKLNKFKGQGMDISIDDFGTGYSSLSYLKKLPITTIKIDKSFVSGLPFDKDDIELVKTIITLGHSLNLNVLAEGVETDLQLKFLSDHNCDYAQGYYFHRPLDLNKFEELKIAS